MTLKYAKNVFANGALPPIPLGGAHNVSQDPIVGPTPLVFGQICWQIGHDFYLFGHG